MGKMTTRVFTITQRPVEANSSIVTGQISYFGTFLYILIDCDATHCFIAKSLVERLKV